MRIIAAFLASAPLLLFAAPAEQPVPKGSYSMKGIIDEKHSAPFACMFGDFTVKVRARSQQGIEASIVGSGMLINSGWLHNGIAQHPDIISIFPSDAKIQDGGRLSVFCNTQDGHIGYFVTE